MTTAISRLQALFLILVMTLLIAASAAIPFIPTSRGDEKMPADPWKVTQTLRPADLARELNYKNEKPPTIIYVGFHTLFAGGHIPGATFHGAASTEQGIAELKKWADTLPRTASLVIYCGCCPFEKCPNIRPAFAALDKMGFKKLRVLILPANFATDWADKSYPMERAM